MHLEEVCFGSKTEIVAFLTRASLLTQFIRDYVNTEV